MKLVKSFIVLSILSFVSACGQPPNTSGTQPTSLVNSTWSESAGLARLRLKINKDSVDVFVDCYFNNGQNVISQTPTHVPARIEGLKVTGSFTTTYRSTGNGLGCSTGMYTTELLFSSYSGLAHVQDNDLMELAEMQRN